MRNIDGMGVRLYICGWYGNAQKVYGMPDFATLCMQKSQNKIVRAPCLGASKWAQIAPGASTKGLPL